MCKKLISIVLPTFNGSKYLSESIDSILSQTYKNWELIIVDDCSTDGTLKIAKSYEKQDKRIKVLHNTKNMRLPNSLNRGFKVSNGELLTWTSDDNLYLPNAIETMVESLESHDVYMVCAGVQTINDNGDVTGQLIPYDEKTMLIRDTVGACFMYKREVYDKIGDYDDSLFCVEDYDYWLRVLKKYRHIEWIPKILYKYRFHDASLTATKASRVLEMRTRIYDKYLDDIFANLGNQKCWLVQAYYDYVMAGRLCEDKKNRFFMFVPELKYENLNFSKQDSYIIFGAGKYGNKALKHLGNLAVCFADNSKDKQGTMKEGIHVLSLEESIKRYPKSKIVVSIGGEHTYEAIMQIIDNGINEYLTYQSLINKEI